MKKSPIIAVYFKPPGFEDYPFNDVEFRQAYHEMGELIVKRGARFFVVRGEESYRGKNAFSHGWEYVDSHFVRREGPITVDLIWNRDPFPDATAKIVDDPELFALLDNKMDVYCLFPHLFPRTEIVRDKSALAPALLQLETDRIVGKPIDGGCGRGVMIGSREEIMSKIASFPYLLQEFIDTSGGIPGIIDGTHDLRLITIEGEIILTYLRTPKAGTLISNVALGGKEVKLDTASLPQETIAIFREVDLVLAKYPRRFYCVDMGRDRSGTWKLIELNGTPGMSIRAIAPWYLSYQEKIADFLIRSAQV